MSDDLVCNVCGKQFKSQKKLSDHSWATHSDENLPCSSCDKTFRTKTHLANHITNKHTEKEPVQCDFKTNNMTSTYYSTSKGNLKAHKKRVHEKVTVLDQHKFACSSCDFKTDKKFNLERHNVSCKRLREPIPNMSSCNQCGKMFSSQKTLRSHTKVHNKDKAEVSTISVHCVVCQKTFSKQWNLKRHQQKEHGLTEKGNIVQNSLGMAVFTTEALVKERVIQKVHAPASVQCNQCNYKAKTRWLLKRHMLDAIRESG